MIERNLAHASARVPRHLAVEIAGGDAGARDPASLLRFAREAAARGIEIVSVSVPDAEAAALVAAAAAIADRFAAAGIRVAGLGNARRRAVAESHALAELQARTARCRRLLCNVTLGYDPRREIVDAVRALAADVRAGRRAVAALGDDALAPYLTTAGLPDPDLLIRVGGTPSVPASFLLQIAYTELWASPLDWRRFGAAELDRALEDFGGRQRRFGS